MASGATWGAAAIWLFPIDDIAHQVLVAFIVAGMCAGAVASMSPMLSSLVVFVVFAISPAIIQFFLIGTEISYVMALTGILFAIIIRNNYSQLLRR